MFVPEELFCEACKKRYAKLHISSYNVYYKCKCGHLFYSKSFSYQDAITQHPSAFKPSKPREEKQPIIIDPDKPFDPFDC